MKLDPIGCLCTTAALDLQLSKGLSWQDLTVQHLVWGQLEPRGRSGSRMPVCLVVELDVVRKRVCIFPLFSYWQAGDRSHFLLSALITWWPCWEVPPLTAAYKPARGLVAVMFGYSGLMLLCMWGVLKFCEIYGSDRLQLYAHTVLDEASF